METIYGDLCKMFKCLALLKKHLIFLFALILEQGFTIFLRLFAQKEFIFEIVFLYFCICHNNSRRTI
jgi:hypothetical protein